MFIILLLRSQFRDGYFGNILSTELRSRRPILEETYQVRRRYHSALVYDSLS